MRKAVILEFHHMELPDANEVSLQQAALLLLPENSYCGYISKTTYCEICPKVYNSNEASLPYPKAHHHKRSPSHSRKLSSVLLAHSLHPRFWDHWENFSLLDSSTIKRKTVPLPQKKPHHTSRGPYNIHFSQV